VTAQIWCISLPPKMPGPKVLYGMIVSFSSIWCSCLEVRIEKRHSASSRAGFEAYSNTLSAKAAPRFVLAYTLAVSTVTL
jgi:hypothetical protein